jgi:RluA family pseudouridine synthase
MSKPSHIDLGFGKHAASIPILYEDRSVLAVDKPEGWMLVPVSWQNTQRNLQAALNSSIAAGDFWARSRSLKFLRYAHRLDADTTGILLLVKSQNALDQYSELFETRRMEKIYLAVVRGVPPREKWISRAKLAPDPSQVGRMLVDARGGKDAETHFRLLATRADAKLGDLALVEARPVTGRTHQIRVHLADAGHQVLGDEYYGKPGQGGAGSLALRSIFLGYTDPFRKCRVEIRAPSDAFQRKFGWPGKLPDTNSTK